MRYTALLIITATELALQMGLLEAAAADTSACQIQEILAQTLTPPKHETGIKAFGYSVYERIWGTEPDLNTPQTTSAHPTESQYLCTIILHLAQIKQVRHNTALRSRTIAMLTGIIGTGFAHRFFGGFHSDLSTLATTASGLVTGIGSWLLANRCINRDKQEMLSKRTEPLLHNTPAALLQTCYASPKGQINVIHIGDFAIAYKLMQYIDEPTFEHMRSYWIKNQRPQFFTE
jgi:hypothetical protein